MFGLRMLKFAASGVLPLLADAQSPACQVAGVKSVSSTENKMEIRNKFPGRLIISTTRDMHPWHPVPLLHYALQLQWHPVWKTKFRD